MRDKGKGNMTDRGARVHHNPRHIFLEGRKRMTLNSRDSISQHY
jgi:hypothetical protein